MDFTISVIIPIYNVEYFIKKTIESVLQQPEVNEIVVVDDGSKDNSLKIVESLKAKCSKIEIYTHKNGVNKGRSATRNLGIKKAKSNYIAFLDADDFYLLNRFSKDKLMLSNTNVDGVYSAVGFHFYRDTTIKESKHFKLNTLSEKLNPENLFKGIVKSKYGFLHLNGITIKKEVFKTIGLFNESLSIAEDTDIIFKIALKCTMLPSEINVPVALRGVHDDNVFNEDDLYKTYTPKCFESLIGWSLKHNMAKEDIDELFDALWIFKFKTDKSLITLTLYWCKLMIKFPQLILNIISIKYFPVIRLRKKLFNL